ncbi:MAG: PKD domain-containing protein [Candidatus Omnitrophica bacterium]|nr:PKD domain-containing protein [Candidatus Omnitrophota bacterium]
MKRCIGLLFTSICLLCFCIVQAYAKDIPWHHSRAKYFYVFGSDGDPLLGADDHELTLYVDVPSSETSDVAIEVFDPDTGSHHDFRTDSSNTWDTVTEFSVFGKDLLDKKEFGAQDYNKAYYKFGPYSADKGQAVSNFYRFKIVAKGVKGDDANLFRFRIMPDSANVYSDNITIRLLPNQGDKMYFYPEISPGTKYVILENYDLDAEGGTSEIFAGRNVLFGESTTRHTVEDSPSGEWRKTQIPVNAITGGRLKYIITKGTQKYAHAGIKVYDDKGALLPLYFEQGPAPAPIIEGQSVPVSPVKAVVVTQAKDLGCNKFTFDATDSYDITNRDLSFDWDFGDGNTSKEQVVTHVYEKGGTYTVRLTAKDDSGLGCDTATTTQTVRVNTPPKARFTSPETACLSDNIYFDASGTTDDTSSNLSYVWDFGDGSKAEGLKVRKQYDKGGTYKVSLLVDDNEESSCSTDTVSRSIRINTAPVAVAGSDIDICLEDFKSEYKVIFDGSASYDTDKDRLSYLWDLGDGTEKTGVKITHVYQKPGHYNVTLTVDDGSSSACGTAKDTLKVVLNKAPIASIKTRESKICVGDEVIFDGSGSSTESGENLKYAWDFGDGSRAEGVQVTHVYKKGGKYFPRLVVDDTSDTRCSQALATAVADVNTAPVAKIDAPSVICIGKAVTFDASGSGDPDGDALRYYWSIGDEAVKQAGPKMVYTFNSGGVHTVRLMVDDGRGYECSKTSTAFNIRVNTPPVANAGINLACCVDENTYFDGSYSTDADGDKLSYSWDFGDGKKADGVKVNHVYTKPGRYNVVLTVDDNSGTECNTSVSSFTASVNAPPVPIIKIR